MCRSGNDTQVVPYNTYREVSQMDKTLYNAYVSILKEELLPAMGCTEPIAVAYAAAVAARELGVTPETVEIVVSGTNPRFVLQIGDFRLSNNLVYTDTRRGDH